MGTSEGTATDAFGDITAQQLESLAAEHGEGFWLLNLPGLSSGIARFREAFVGAGWPDTDIAWSYKTLWIPPVARTAMASGCRSEVVSRHEYELAMSLGADPGTTIVNGPLTTPDDLLRYGLAGSLINLDSPDEVADLVALAATRPDIAFRVGLRANVDIGQGDRGRFGLDAESDDLRTAFELLASVDSITVEGLHLHISGARDADSFRRRTERLVALARELWPEGSAPGFLDVGGGFMGPMPDALVAQLGYAPASPADYAAAIVPVLRQAWPEGGPTLIVEPGIALAADTMSFAARVGATKVIDGVRHAIITGSVHTVKPARHRLEMPYRVVSGSAEPPPDGTTVVSGWTCIEDDILVRACPVALCRGDWLVFDNVGAYTFVLNPRFIRGTPAVLTRDESGAWSSLRPADDVESWTAPFASL